MHNGIESIRQSRIHLLKLIEELTTIDLNKIPPGFNNNVIWNVGHLIAAQQSICYIRSGVKPFVDEGFLALYKSGTKPLVDVTESGIDEMKALFLKAIDQFEKDFEKSLFSSAPAWVTGYGIRIYGIEDSINFTLFHEGLHRGYIMALKRVLSFRN